LIRTVFDVLLELNLELLPQIIVGLIMAIATLLIAKSSISLKYKIITISVVALILLILLIVHRVVGNRTDSMQNEGDNHEPPTESIHVSNQAELIALIEVADGDSRIELTNNISITTSLIIPSGKNIVLLSDVRQAFSIIADGNFHAIIVENGAELTIDGIRVTRSPGTEGRGVYNLGIVVMENGFIDGHVNNYSGALGWGSGVFNEFGASFTMRGGVISNNRTASRGGGIYNHVSATLIIEGGEIIYNTANYGGGIFNWGNFNMQGGRISNNTAQTYGGGVFNSASFNHTGGDIINNEPIDMAR